MSGVRGGNYPRPAQKGFQVPAPRCEDPEGVSGPFSPGCRVPGGVRGPRTPFRVPHPASIQPEKLIPTLVFHSGKPRHIDLCSTNVITHPLTGEPTNREGTPLRHGGGKHFIDH